MITSQVEYLGFRSCEDSRDYRLVVRHPDGEYDHFVVAIQHSAFLAHRVRYQDGAEICFQKLRRALDEWTAAPDTGRPAKRLDVTDADLQAYKEAHAPRVPQRRAAPRPPA